MKTQAENGRREDRESTGTGEELLLQSVRYFSHLQEFANFKVTSGKREKCLSRARGCLEAGVEGEGMQERAGTGEGRYGRALPSTGDKGMGQMMRPGVARQVGGSGGSIRFRIRDKQLVRYKDLSNQNRVPPNLQNLLFLFSSQLPHR